MEGARFGLLGDRRKHICLRPLFWGAPDGEYVVLQFQADFENKAQAVETITPMLDEGQWRVSGYYIR